MLEFHIKLKQANIIQISLDIFKVFIEKDQDIHYYNILELCTFE